MEFKKNRLSKNYNEKELIKDAIKENKYLMVYATSKTCYFCKKMKREVLNVDEVQKKLNENYIFVEVDVEY